MEFDNEICLTEPEYDYMDETFAENLLEIVYNNLEDIMAGRVIRFIFRFLFILGMLLIDLKNCLHNPI